MTHSSSAEQRVRRAHLSATILVTALSGLALVATIVLSAGALPDRMATHFDSSGSPNDDMATIAALVLFLGVGFVVPAVLVWSCAASQWWRGGSARAVAGFLAGFAVWLNAIFAGLVLANRGATAPEEVSLHLWVLLVALVLGIVVGTVVARAVPRGAVRTAPEPVGAVALAPGERASWFGRVETGRPAMLVMVAGVLVMVVAALVSGLWWLWPITALVALLVVAITSFVVTVDASGVTWRSTLGLPRGHIPLEQIAGAGVTDVSPTDFGGFGLRMTSGALGLVSRWGSALEVVHGGRRFVATVDDAASGAGLLLGYLGRSDQAGGNT